METFSFIFLTIVGLLLIILNAILWLKFKRFDKLFSGPESHKSDKILLQDNSANLKKLDKDVQELYEINSRISKISKRGICKIGFVNFNAFSEKSGNQSFAIALLDFRDSGVIFSNLQTAQGARLFIRPIRQGESANGSELLAEEKKALERAKQVIF